MAAFFNWKVNNQLILFYLSVLAGMGTQTAAAPPQTLDVENICGREHLPSSRDARVWNGEEIHPAKIPWIVSIQTKGKGIHVCGGSIIAPGYVLSAAHCFQNLAADDVEVRLGLYRNATLFPNSGLVVEEIKVHEDYNPFLDFENDIAILKLRNDLSWNEGAVPICMPSEDLDEINNEGKLVRASGWGRRWKYGFGAASETLQTVNLTLMDINTCSRVLTSLSYRSVVIRESKLCAGNAEGDKERKDTTPGDSGGPLALYKNGHWTLLGITSIRLKSSDPNLMAPGVYTRVSHFKCWIQKAIDESWNPGSCSS